MSMRNLKAGLGVTDQLLDVVVLLEHVRTKLLVLVVQSFHLVIKKMVRIVVMPMLRTLGQGSFAVYLQISSYLVVGASSYHFIFDFGYWFSI